MTGRIKTYSNEHGTWYYGTREQLMNTGLATADMFPAEGETWRGNGPLREQGESLWSVQRADGSNYLVLHGDVTS